MSLQYRTFQAAGRASSHIIPGAYSRIDSVKGAAGLASSTNGVIIGPCTGGKPATLYQFNTIAEAVSTLRGGPLMDAVRLAFNPGGGLNPQRLFAMRINNATQASLDLEAFSTPKITVKSRDYGVYTNQIKVTVENGTSFGKKVTVEYQSDPAEIFDNIRRQSFTVQVTDGQAATITITNTTLTISNRTPVDLASFDTIGDLVSHINAMPGVTCTVISGQENAKPIELDNIGSTSINTAPYTVESSMHAMIDIVNAQSARVSMEVAPNDPLRRIVDNLTATFLTGGTEGSSDAVQWAAALTQLEAENVQFISTPDSSEAVHATIKTHCEAMSSVTGRKERQFIVGAPWKSGTVATDISSAISAAKTLNSKTGMYVFNGGTQRDLDGVIQNYPGSYAACMLMGQKCALAINQPLTFKELNFIELEYKLSDSQTEQLLQEGVAVVNYSPNGLARLVRQFNTYQTNDLKWNEFSAVTEMFFASRDLRQVLENQFVGRPGTAITEGVLKGTVEARLQIYEDLGIFMKDPKTGSSWFNVQIILNGDQVFIDYDAYITLPINFMFTVNHFHELVATI